MICVFVKCELGHIHGDIAKKKVDESLFTN